MDTQTTIIAVIILLLCLLPFLLLHFKNGKKRKQSLQILSAIAKKNHCTIEKSEFWNQLVIGIDRKHKMLIFSVKSDDSATYRTINLAEIQKCNLVMSKDNTKLIEKLELKLEFFDSDKSALILEFYNKNQTITLVNELELIKKWHKIVNDSL